MTAQIFKLPYAPELDITLTDGGATKNYSAAVSFGKDMHDIADSFVRVLMGTFHTRMEYPENSNKPKDIEEVSKEDEDSSRKPKPKKKS